MSQSLSLKGSCLKAKCGRTKKNDASDTLPQGRILRFGDAGATVYGEVFRDTPGIQPAIVQREDHHLTPNKNRLGFEQS